MAEEDIKYKILIVDDDKFLLDMYALKFKEGGYEVELALGSVAALDRLKEEDAFFDIVLMDVVMPALDGFELLEKIREMKLVETAKIIILSNLGQPSDIERGKKLGADGYIIKADSTPSEVVAKVKEIMKK